MINVKLPLQPHQEYCTTQYGEFGFLLAYSAERWFILPILTTSLIHLPLRGWENVLYELGCERSTCLQTDMNGHSIIKLYVGSDPIRIVRGIGFVLHYMLCNCSLFFSDRPHNPMLNSGSLMLCSLLKVITIRVVIVVITTTTMTIIYPPPPPHTHTHTHTHTHRTIAVLSLWWSSPLW